MDEDALRAHIVATADELFNRHGIQAVGIDRLRSAMDVSLKRFYSVFPSKDALVIAVLDRRHDNWTAGVERRVAGETDPTDRLLAVYDYLADRFEVDSFRGCVFVNAFGELGGVSDEVAAVARSHKRSFQDYVSTLVAGIGGSADLAAQLAILAEGALTTAGISGSGEAAGSARRAAAVLIQADRAMPGESGLSRSGSARRAPAA